MSPLATLHLPASPGAPLSPTLSGSPTSSDSDSLISRDPSDQDSDSGEPEDGSSDAPGVKQDGRTWVRRIHHEWLRGAIEQRKKALVAREQAAGSGKQIMENLYNNLTADFLEKFGYALPVHSVWPKGVGMVRPPSNQVQAAEIAKKTHRRIADWLRNNMKAPRHSQAVPAPNSPAIDIVEMLKMFAKKPTKPSRLIIYMDRVYYEKIKPVVDSRMETEPNKRLRVSIQHEIATKMLEAEAPEFLKDIDTERDVRHEEAMRAYNATTDIGDGATLSPEERHRCISKLIPLLQRLTDALSQTTGAVVFVGLAGLMPTEGGLPAFQPASVHAGKSSAAHAEHWFNFDRTGFAAAMDSFCKFAASAGKRHPGAAAAPIRTSGMYAVDSGSDSTGLASLDPGTAPAPTATIAQVAAPAPTPTPVPASTPAPVPALASTIAAATAAASASAHAPAAASASAYAPAAASASAHAPAAASASAHAPAATAPAPTPAPASVAAPAPVTRPSAVGQAKAKSVRSVQSMRRSPDSDSSVEVVSSHYVKPQTERPAVNGPVTTSLIGDKSDASMRRSPGSDSPVEVVSSLYVTPRTDRPVVNGPAVISLISDESDAAMEAIQRPAAKRPAKASTPKLLRVYKSAASIAREGGSPSDRVPKEGQAWNYVRSLAYGGQDPPTSPIQAGDIGHRFSSPAVADAPAVTAPPAVVASPASTITASPVPAVATSPVSAFVTSPVSAIATSPAPAVAAASADAIAGPQLGPGLGCLGMGASELRGRPASQGISAITRTRWPGQGSDHIAKDGRHKGAASERFTSAWRAKLDSMVCEVVPSTIRYPIGVTQPGATFFQRAYDDTYDDLLAAFYLWMMGSPKAGQLPQVSGRPAVVGAWINTGRRLDHRMVLKDSSSLPNVTTWWDKLKACSWDRLNVHGGLGMFLVMGAMVFWREAIERSCHGPDGSLAAWEDVARELTIAFEVMAGLNFQDFSFPDLGSSSGGTSPSLEVSASASRPASHRAKRKAADMADAGEKTASSNLSRRVSKRRA